MTELILELASPNASVWVVALTGQSKMLTGALQVILLYYPILSFHRHTAIRLSFFMEVFGHIVMEFAS